jgi:hypothetical protein
LKSVNHTKEVIGTLTRSCTFGLHGPANELALRHSCFLGDEIMHFYFLLDQVKQFLLSMRVLYNFVLRFTLGLWLKAVFSGN